MKASKLVFRIRLMIGTFVLLLLLSGITAFPVYTELKWIHDNSLYPSGTLLGDWLEKSMAGSKSYE